MSAAAAVPVLVLGWADLSAAGSRLLLSLKPQNPDSSYLKVTGIPLGKDLNLPIAHQLPNNSNDPDSDSAVNCNNKSPIVRVDLVSADNQSILVRLFLIIFVDFLNVLCIGRRCRGLL
eukprot:TRINITY_DN1301_c0_g1_i1.p1 TRINITY_DN1301_c0_g1~~TRINITY_DN1301_c0_g1_i1.p1  ORF type:complete len:118 (-),score=24.48 TRINITY_DN1301_c0_g1_i1:2-355(-)